MVATVLVGRDSDVTNDSKTDIDMQILIRIFGHQICTATVKAEGVPKATNNCWRNKPWIWSRDRGPYYLKYRRSDFGIHYSCSAGLGRVPMYHSTGNERPFIGFHQCVLQCCTPHGPRTKSIGTS